MSFGGPQMPGVTERVKEPPKTYLTQLRSGRQPGSPDRLGPKVLIIIYLLYHNYTHYDLCQPAHMLSSYVATELNVVNPARSHGHKCCKQSLSKQTWYGQCNSYSTTETNY